MEEVKEFIESFLVGKILSGEIKPKSYKMEQNENELILLKNNVY